MAGLSQSGEDPRKDGLKRFLPKLFPGFKLIIVCCNVCPILTELELKDEELQKIAIIERQLHQVGVDTAALREMRLSDTGSLHEVNYHFC